MIFNKYIQIYLVLSLDYSLQDVVLHNGERSGKLLGESYMQCSNIQRMYSEFKWSLNGNPLSSNHG